MKNLLAILILFLTMHTKQSEYISIEHIGISDKPINTIVISKDKIANFETENFMVKNEVYDNLRELILSNTKGHYKENEFGSFKITIKKKTKNGLSQCFNRLQSIELLSKLIKALEKNKKTNNELLTRLEIVKKRIIY